MSEKSVAAWETASGARRRTRRWPGASCHFAVAMLASGTVFAQTEPPKAPPVGGTEVPPPASTTAPAQVAVQPAATDEVRALREELARQSAELAAQRAELDRLANQSETADALQAAEVSVTETDEYQEKLSFYGFMDMGLQKAWLGRHAIANVVTDSTASTFVLGNVNLYIDAHPFAGWRALAEVRFTTYPNGEFTLGAPGQPVTRTSTTIQDANSSSGPWTATKWGSIILERAQIEYSAADWFNVKTGYWFTPYGIWNIDHGSPTLIALNQPQFVVFEGFPARQLGVDVNGVFHASSWDIEYHAYVSNGRTPGQHDLTDDKMVGGRLAARTSAPFQFTAGASSFYGRMSDKILIMESYTPITATRKEFVAMKEWGLAGDISADAGPVRFRSEFVMNERRYDEGKRPITTTGAFAADRRTWSAYGLLAYQLPWFGLEPYLYFEYNRDITLGSEEPRTGDFSQVVTMSSIGLNIHFSPATQLKIQYAHDEFSDIDDLGRNFDGTDSDFLSSRLVVSF
jgi:hypothetical protein